MNKTDNVKAARCTDALLNYETVMYFSNEDLEVQRYADAVGEYQARIFPADPGFRRLRVKGLTRPFQNSSSQALLERQSDLIMS